jgi:tetratricopeptide (TPR) repeat protein
MKAMTQASASRRVRVLAFASLFIVWLAAFATTAHADAFAAPTNAVAHEHFVTGNRYYRRREYEKAVEEYKAGAIRDDAPVFDYNLGQCYRRLGRYEDALWHYERFIDRGKPTGQPGAVVNDLVVQMKEAIEKQATKQPPAEPTSTPSPPPTSANPGQSLPAEQPLPASLPAERRSGLPVQRKLAVGVGAAGVAAVGLGLVLGLRAQSLEDDAAEICPMTSCARANEANELINRGKTNALYANVAYGAGAAAILGAAVLWITGSPADHRGTAIAPQFSRTFAGVAASRRF